MIRTLGKLITNFDKDIAIITRANDYVTTNTLNILSDLNVKWHNNDYIDVNFDLEDKDIYVLVIRKHPSEDRLALTYDYIWDNYYVNDLVIIDGLLL